MSYMVFDIYDEDGKCLSDTIDAAPYTHKQTVASTTWTITHRLGKYPVVNILSASGEVIHGQVSHMSKIETQLYFNTAITGTAILR